MCLLQWQIWSYTAERALSGRYRVQLISFRLWFYMFWHVGLILCQLSYKCVWLCQARLHWTDSCPAFDLWFTARNHFGQCLWKVSLSSSAYIEVNVNNVFKTSQPAAADAVVVLVVVAECRSVVVEALSCGSVQRWCRSRRRSAVAVTSNTASARCTSRSRRPTTAYMAICRTPHRSTTTPQCTTITSLRHPTARFKFCELTLYTVFVLKRVI